MLKKGERCQSAKDAVTCTVLLERSKTKKYKSIERDGAKFYTYTNNF